MEDMAGETHGQLETSCMSGVVAVERTPFLQEGREGGGPRRRQTTCTSSAIPGVRQNFVEEGGQGGRNGEDPRAPGDRRNITGEVGVPDWTMWAVACPALAWKACAFLIVYKETEKRVSMVSTMWA